MYISEALGVDAPVAAWLRGDALLPAAEQLFVRKVSPIASDAMVKIETPAPELLVDGLVLRVGATAS